MFATLIPSKTDTWEALTVYPAEAAKSGGEDGLSEVEAWSDGAVGIVFSILLAIGNHNKGEQIVGTRFLCLNQLLQQFMLCSLGWDNRAYDECSQAHGWLRREEFCLQRPSIAAACQGTVNAFPVCCLAFAFRLWSSRALAGD